MSRSLMTAQEQHEALTLLRACVEDDLSAADEGGGLTLDTLAAVESFLSSFQPVPRWERRP